MWHMGRDAEHFTGVDHDFFAIDPELERAVEDVSELLVVVAVFGNDAAFFRRTRASMISWPTTNWRCSSGLRSSSGIVCQGTYCIALGLVAARLARDFAGFG